MNIDTGFSIKGSDGALKFYRFGDDVVANTALNRPMVTMEGVRVASSCRETMV